jgi:hypothetical protein
MLGEIQAGGREVARVEQAVIGAGFPEIRALEAAADKAGVAPVRLEKVLVVERLVLELDVDQFPHGFPPEHVATC